MVLWNGDTKGPQNSSLIFCNSREGFWGLRYIVADFVPDFKVQNLDNEHKAVYYVPAFDISLVLRPGIWESKKLFEY